MKKQTYVIEGWEYLNYGQYNEVHYKEHSTELKDYGYNGPVVLKLALGKEKRPTHDPDNPARITRITNSINLNQFITIKEVNAVVKSTGQEKKLSGP
jgi:hypothetical protein